MLLGGGAGLGTGILVGTGLTQAAIALAGVVGTIAVSWPVVIGICAVASLCGGLASKALVRKVFGNKKVEEFQQALAENLRNELQRMRENVDMEQNIKAQVDMVFDKLKEKIESETESVLTDLENTLNGIDRQIAEHRGLAEHEKTELLTRMKELSAISSFSLELNKSLLAEMAK